MILTWTCHICKKERPDPAISVRNNMVMKYGITMQENVRYCNDDPDCVRKSRTFSHFGGK